MKIEWDLSRAFPLPRTGAPGLSSHRVYRVRCFPANWRSPEVMLKLGQYWRDCGGQVAQPAVAAAYCALRNNGSPWARCEELPASRRVRRERECRGEAPYQREGRCVTTKFRCTEVDRAVPHFSLLRTESARESDVNGAGKFDISYISELHYHIPQYSSITKVHMLCMSNFHFSFAQLDVRLITLMRQLIDLMNFM